jgi:hypothetical protein
MKTTKLILSALTVVAAASSFGQYASPEVMLVTDSGGTTPAGTTAGAQIERYDPISGDYLGAFGLGMVTSPSGIAVSGQTAYVADNLEVSGVFFSRIDKFNWSTGAYLGSLFDPAPFLIQGLSVYGNSLLASDIGNGTGADSALYTFDLTTGNKIGSVSLPASSFPSKVTTIGSQAFVSGAGGANSGGIYRYDLNANGTVAGSATQIATNPIGAIAGYTSKSGTNYVFSGGTSSTSPVIQKWTTSGTLVDSLSLGAGHSFPTTLGFGHNGMMYSMEIDGTSINRYDAETPLFLGSLGSFQLTNTGNSQSFAVYAAPEPLTVLGFGVGVLALIRRRRR